MAIFITAEIGINHNGDIDICKQLIDVAVDSGCDAVKFQKREIDLVYTKDFLDSYRESPWGKTQKDQKMGLEFGKEEYLEINDYCKKKNIDWFASAWDLNSQLFLRDFNFINLFFIFTSFKRPIVLYVFDSIAKKGVFKIIENTKP